MYRLSTCVALVVTAFSVLGGAPAATAQVRPDETALVVNGEPISTWEIELLLPQVRTELASQGREAGGETQIKVAVSRAVDSLLLAQEARRRGIEPDQERVAAKMKAIADRAGGRAELEADLIRSGVTYDQLRATVVQADLVRSLVEAEGGTDAAVAPEDVEAFYTENIGIFTSPDKIHARHILFKVGPDATDAERERALERARAARVRALSGEDFALLARQLSEGPNAARGGDLGFTTRGQMVEPFDDAVWALEPGEISDVVESGLGYHVIKVEEIVPGEVVPLDEAYELVENLLRERHTAEVLAALVTKLRATADIHEPEE